jgi:3-hydroxyacyl-CoA dehydrogenase
MSLIQSEIRQNIQVLRLDYPPVNGLGLELRKSIYKHVQDAIESPDVRAIILTGAGKVFCGGADIKEFGQPQASIEPILISLIDFLENCPKPIIAAIQGVCMGGGFELAMGCHYRVAHADAIFALPEVKLGLLPGAGGTQKLTRLIGVERALNIMLSGDSVKALEMSKLKVVDKLCSDNLDQFMDFAIQFSVQILNDARTLPRVRDLKVDYPNYQAFLEFSKNTVLAVAPHYPAPLAIVDCVKAACTMSYKEGMTYERSKFIELMGTPQSKAMRHAFTAERACSKIPDIGSDIKPLDVKSIAVIGSGTMGGGIAMNFLNIGIPVKILDTTTEALERGISVIHKNYAQSLSKGKLTQDQYDKRISLLTSTLEYSDLSQVDMVIEAVFEEMAVKKIVFEKLDQFLKPGAILATNTSTLDVDQIAAFTKRPSDVIGTHFFSPANVMKLLEVVRGKQTSKTVLATVMNLAKKIKKTAVVSGVCDGFIGNRMIEHYIRMSVQLVEQGATPEQVDKALEKWGMVMGPFRMSDLAGNDIGWAIRKRRYVEKPNVIYSKLADEICEVGRFGQKTGKGWYLYEKGGRKPIPDPEVEKIINQFRDKNNIKTHRFTDEEIIERTIYALINEGARILEEGIALRASDIDMVYLTGYGFPVHRGGPMKYADQVGLFNVARVMNKLYQQSNDSFWEPASLIKQLIDTGKTLT